MFTSGADLEDVLLMTVKQGPQWPDGLVVFCVRIESHAGVKYVPSLSRRLYFVMVLDSDVPARPKSHGLGLASGGLGFQSLAQAWHGLSRGSSTVNAIVVVF